jgi:hypothetical protein
MTAGMPYSRATIEPWAASPLPYGTPLVLGRLFFRIALFLFRYYQLPVTGFEQALCIIGATAGTFFARDVDYLRGVIRTFRPDAVFAIERPAAMAAARLSSAELEPLNDDKVVHTGPFQRIDRPALAVPYAQRKKVVAYTGSGGISAARLVRALESAFADTTTTSMWQRRR